MSKSTSNTPKGHRSSSSSSSSKSSSKHSKSASVPTSPASSAAADVVAPRDDHLRDRSSCVVTVANSHDINDDRRTAARAQLLVHAMLLKRQRWSLGQLVAIRRHADKDDENASIALASLTLTSAIDAHSRALFHPETLANLGHARSGDALVLSEASSLAPVMLARRVAVSAVDATLALPPIESLDAMLKSQWHSLHVVVGNTLSVNGITAQPCFFRIQRIVEPTEAIVTRLSSRTEYVLSNDSANHICGSACRVVSNCCCASSCNRSLSAVSTAQRERLARFVELPLRAT
jgi:hypothetical protein